MTPYKVMLKIKCSCNALGYYWTTVHVQAPNAKTAIEAAKSQFAGHSATMRNKIIGHEFKAYP